MLRHSKQQTTARYIHSVNCKQVEAQGMYLEAPGVTGRKAGAHIFRRYRNSFLRTNSCPAGLLKYWMGHSRKSDITDVYDKSPEDSEWRAEMAQKLGTGFSIPSCTECTEKTKTATELIAV